MDNKFFVPKVLPFERAYWVVPGKFMAGHLPYQHNKIQGIESLKYLVTLGVRCFINLMEDGEADFDGVSFPDYQQELKNIEMQVGETIYFYRYSIKDMNIPSIPLMYNILDTIETFIAKNKAVYVHCWGGKGRTGTVVGCFLLENKMATVDNVIEMISYLRRTDPKSDYPSPETKEQVDFVKNWVNFIK